MTRWTKEEGAAWYIGHHDKLVQATSELYGLLDNTPLDAPLPSPVRKAIVERLAAVNRTAEELYLIGIAIRDDPTAISVTMPYINDPSRTSQPSES